MILPLQDVVQLKTSFLIQLPEKQIKTYIETTRIHLKITCTSKQKKKEI
jgi:hypothetical protein